VTEAQPTTIAREFYEAFQRTEFDRLDAFVAEGVLINSPAGYGMSGLQVLKDWAVQFTDLAHRINLVDEHEALDDTATGRGFITFCLYWKHAKPFLGLEPTGREGTSVESILFTIEDGMIVRLDVAGNTADLVIYEWERGWNLPHNIRPEPIVTGVECAQAPA
jgi:SnoaL-like domain